MEGARNKYVEMTLKLIDMPEEWQESEEGEAYLDEMDAVWDSMSEEDIKLAQSDIIKKISQ